MESETELALYEVAAAVATGQAERDGHSDGVDAAGLTDQREILTRTWIHAVVDSARLCTEAGPIREPTGLVASSPPTSAFAGEVDPVRRTGWLCGDAVAVAVEHSFVLDG